MSSAPKFHQQDSVASEMISAALGGAFSSAALYPLEVLKTRIQADEHDNKAQPEDEDHDDNCNIESNSMFSYAHRLYSREGPGVFYKGIEVSASLSALEKACYFCAYTFLKQLATKSKGSPATLSVGTNLFLGCLAEWCHLPLTLPIDTFTTAIQTQKPTSIQQYTKSEAALALWMTLWKQKSFYKGIAAYCVLCFKPALQYTIFERLKVSILAVKQKRSRLGMEQRQQLELSAGEAFFLGMFSRMIATLVVFPFVRAKVRLQSHAKDDKGACDAATTAHGTASTSLWTMLHLTYKEEGFAALYQGLGPEITRGVLSAALMMMAKERISSGVKGILHRK
jgi:adenine nucleotide transporter 17